MKRRELVMKIQAMLGQLKLWVAASKNASNVDVGVDIDLGDLDPQTPARASIDPGQETDGEVDDGMGEETDGEGDGEVDGEPDGEMSEEMDEEMQLEMYAGKFGMTREELYGESEESETGGESDAEEY